uniref:Uncharacterized protein n=1 Tax=Setaria italica TaxID=4555 RepID=K3Y3W1_SETIT
MRGGTGRSFAQVAICVSGKNENATSNQKPRQEKRVPRASSAPPDLTSPSWSWTPTPSGNAQGNEGPFSPSGAVVGGVASTPWHSRLAVPP